MILYIGDGMGFSHVAGGGMYANGAAGSLAMEALPCGGRLQTASLSGMTDSATGRKIEPRMPPPRDRPAWARLHGRRPAGVNTLDRGRSRARGTEKGYFRAPFTG